MIAIRASKHSMKCRIESTVNFLVSMAFSKLPKIELIEMPKMRTTRFDEDALEYEITIKVRPAREKLKRSLREAV